MTVEIGNIIKTLLEPFVVGGSGSNQFIDKLAGVVKTVSMSEKKDENIFITKTYPVSCDVTFDECTRSGAYKELMPDSKLGCIVYLEEQSGVDKIGNIREAKQYKVSYLLVGWLNQKKLGTNQCSITGNVVNTIIEQLSVKPFNSGIYQTVQIEVTGQNPKTINPFQKYTYDELATQYLFAPYDYFSIKIEVTVNVNGKCLIPFEALNPLTCNP